MGDDRGVLDIFFSLYYCAVLPCFCLEPEGVGRQTRFVLEVFSFGVLLEFYVDGLGGGGWRGKLVNALLHV